MAVQFADIDNDGDIDVVAGSTTNKVYVQDGPWTFSEIVGSAVPSGNEKTYV